MAKAKTETTTENNVVLFGEKATLPAYAQQDATMGHENVGAEDLALPQIKLLQAISNEVHEIEGAAPGMLLNTLTQELYENVYLINLKFDKTYTIWKDRDLGGGKMGDYDTEEAAKAALSTLPGSESDYAINETATHYVLIVNPETMQVESPAVMYMDRSKLSASRAWNSQINLKSNGQAPRFASVWQVGKKAVKNKRNETYFNLDIDFAGWAPESLYAEAKVNYEGFNKQAA